MTSTTVRTKKYQRKPMEIEAVQVDDSNFSAIALWVSGTIMDTKSETPLADGDAISPDHQYIKVGVRNPINPRQTKAYKGDWILWNGKNFKVYTTKAFKSSFIPA